MAYENLDAIQIGRKLKSLREEKSETMEQLANAIGTSTSAVANYETGQRIPRDEIKIRIAEHFSAPVESIFFPVEQHEMCEK